MLSEKELLQMLLDDPENGLAELMHRYMGYVYTIIHGKLSGISKNEDIEECACDVFYDAYKNRFSIDLQKGSLKAFFSVLATRKAIDRYRRLQKTKDVISLDDELCEPIASEGNLAEDIVNKETCDLLIREIKALGEPDSEILIRKYYLSQNTKSIALALGLKPNTVDKKVSRALAKLKQTLGGVL